MPDKNSLSRYFAAAGVLVVIIFASGFLAGSRQSVNAEVATPAAVDFSLFWQTWELLDDRYVGSTTASTTKDDTQKRVYGAISGMVDSLGDPYTVFLPPEESKSFKEDIKGDFGGVGMELGVRDGELTVISAIAGTPAKAAGITSGDRIVRIAGEDVKKLSVDQAVKKIRGEEGTKITLTIFRPSSNKTWDVTLTRARIQVPTLETKMLPSGVFLLTLHNFNANSASLFRDGLRKFIESKSDKLIIDLRGNPGGYLDASISMASWFLPEGKVVIKEAHGGKAEDKYYRSKGYNVFNDKLKLAILVDEGSASASEILAGALSEHGLATLIGQETFGKGSVQELIPLAGGSSLKVTIAKWFTPNNHSISDKGLTPDIKVELTDKDREAGKDPQLDAAIKFLLGK